jgi:hypothetical protein
MCRSPCCCQHELTNLLIDGSRIRPTWSAWL